MTHEINRSAGTTISTKYFRAHANNLRAAAFDVEGGKLCFIKEQQAFYISSSGQTKLLVQLGECERIVTETDTEYHLDFMVELAFDADRARPGYMQAGKRGFFRLA